MIEMQFPTPGLFVNGRLATLAEVDTLASSERPGHQRRVALHDPVARCCRRAQLAAVTPATGAGRIVAEEASRKLLNAVAK